jgi:hypothetical protein
MLPSTRAISTTAMALPMMPVPCGVMVMMNNNHLLVCPAVVGHDTIINKQVNRGADTHKHTYRAAVAPNAAACQVEARKGGHQAVRELSTLPEARDDWRSVLRLNTAQRAM